MAGITCVVMVIITKPMQWDLREITCVI